MKTPSDEMRLVRRLAVAGRHLVVSEEGVLLRSDAGGADVPVENAVFRRLRASGALCEEDDGRWQLSEPGRSLARRLATSGGSVEAQHQRRGLVKVKDGGEERWVAVDIGESPLAWMRARKGRDGEPMIDDAAFEAGERLRADFTRGQMTPRVTANWNLAASAGRRSGAAGGMGDLTDAAMAARIRVERALTALGPELSGTVLDFCCFLKGIETIERERGWPKRSARLVLQLGLSALARHYGFSREAVGPSGRRDGMQRRRDAG